MPVSLPLLLVLCTGNICRSPMGEALFAHYLARDQLAGTVISRGLAAPPGARPHGFAAATASAHGIPIRPDKRAAQVTTPELAAATVVLVMDSSHRREIRQRYPSASGKTFLLGQWQGQEIADPISQPVQAFEQAWQAIDTGVQAWLPYLLEAGLIHRQHST